MGPGPTGKEKAAPSVLRVRYGAGVSSYDAPTPTEVIASWIPHDSRWHAQARAAAREGTEPLRRYVTVLVDEQHDDQEPVTDPYDLASLGAVVEDLGMSGLDGVSWHLVREALILTDHR